MRRLLAEDVLPTCCDTTSLQKHRLNIVCLDGFGHLNSANNVLNNTWEKLVSMETNRLLYLPLQLLDRCVYANVSWEGTIHDLGFFRHYIFTRGQIYYIRYCPQSVCFCYQRTRVPCIIYNSDYPSSFLSQYIGQSYIVAFESLYMPYYIHVFKAELHTYTSYSLQQADINKAISFHFITFDLKFIYLSTVIEAH